MTEIAKREDWKTVPYDGPVRSIACSETFSTEEFSRLCAGLVPESMEDKWFAFFEEPFLFLHRSWTGLFVYRLRFQVSAGGVRITEAVVSEEVTAAEATYEARFLVWLLRGLMLGQDVPYPVPPDLA